LSVSTLRIEPGNDLPTPLRVDGWCSSDEAYDQLRELKRAPEPQEVPCCFRHRKQDVGLRTGWIGAISLVLSAITLAIVLSVAARPAPPEIGLRP
jgi:hypothetical protein